MRTYPQQPTPSDAYTDYSPSACPVTGIVLHHSAGTSLVNPAYGRSWHFMIDRDAPASPDIANATATIYQAVPLKYAAHHVALTDRWRPNWVIKPPRPLTSDMNYCSIGIEIVYAPQEPYNQAPLPPQVVAVASLIRDIYDTYGRLPVVGHGEVDSSKWPTEPHAFPWDTIFTLKDPLYGRYLLPPPEETPMPMPISVADFKAYLETYGTQVNPDTAIFKRAHLAYERGETRGPALSDEYPFPDPRTNSPQVRQNFTAGTAYYDPATGACDWVEVNLEESTSPPPQ